jgi:hypothetical protein
MVAKFATGVVDTGGKFAAGVVDTGSNFATNVVEQVERHLQGIPYLQLMTGL